MALGVAGADPLVVAPFIFTLMQRNIATPGFVVADHNMLAAPPRPGGYTAVGCVLASPSWSLEGYAYPGNVASISQDYFFNWTRDAAITMAVVLSRTPGSIPAETAAQLLGNYVTFAHTCQASGDIGQAKYTPEGNPTGSADESDGPALRVITILQGFAGLSADAQQTARDVIATDLDYLLANDRYQDATITHWEDTSGQSLFARAVQLRCLNRVIVAGPALDIPVPAAAKAAADWLANELPTHWSGAPDNWYRSVLDPRQRLAGDPAAVYDPSIDPILACIYGDGIDCTDPRLLSTAAQVRAQWSESGSDAFPINVADAGRGIGPLMGRYRGDQYDGLSLTSDTGHPWAVCTCIFAQLYYQLARKILSGVPVPNDPLVDQFFAQIPINKNDPPQSVAQALRDAGDRMLNAVVYHSNNLELSEQFDQGSGFELSVANLTWSYASYLSAVAER